MKKRLTAIVLMSVLLIPALRSEELIDKSDPARFFTLGARLGFNTSNRTFPNTPTTIYNTDNWGTGFDIGLVANLNIKEYLSIQPGFFFESRSGNHAYLYWYYDFFSEYQQYWEMGHSRNFNFTIPVMAVMKFNVMSKIKTSLELGPYFQFSLKDTGEDILVPYQLPQSTEFSTYYAERSKFDIGIKMGAGVQIRGHYYLGVHYLAGMCNTWKNPKGGHNKGWMFTIGYDM